MGEAARGRDGHAAGQPYRKGERRQGRRAGEGKLPGADSGPTPRPNHPQVSHLSVEEASRHQGHHEQGEQRHRRRHQAGRPHDRTLVGGELVQAAVDRGGSAKSGVPQLVRELAGLPGNRAGGSGVDAGGVRLVPEGGDGLARCQQLHELEEVVATHRELHPRRAAPPIGIPGIRRLPEAHQPRAPALLLRGPGEIDAEAVAQVQSELVGADLGHRDRCLAATQALRWELSGDGRDMRPQVVEVGRREPLATVQTSDRSGVQRDRGERPYRRGGAQEDQVRAHLPCHGGVDAALEGVEGVRVGDVLLDRQRSVSGQGVGEGGLGRHHLDERQHRRNDDGDDQAQPERDRPTAPAGGLQPREPCPGQAWTRSSTRCAGADRPRAEGAHRRLRGSVSSSPARAPTRTEGSMLPPLGTRLSGKSTARG